MENEVKGKLMSELAVSLVSIIVTVISIIVTLISIVQACKKKKEHQKSNRSDQS